MRAERGSAGRSSRFLASLVSAVIMVVAWGGVGSAYERPGTTTHISAPHSSQGIPSTSFGVYDTAISGNGRYMAFVSDAPNLMSRPTPPWPNIFFYDRSRRTVDLISKDPFGVPAVGGTCPVQSQTRPSAEGSCSSDPSVSATGRFVSFVSDSSNIVPGDTNAAPDVFVHDTRTARTQRVSVTSDGEQSNEPPLSQMSNSISADGRFVAFESSASNLVPGDDNDVSDVFVFDRKTRKIELVSRGDDGIGNGSSREPSISGNGRFVYFGSSATNLAGGAGGNFVKDRKRNVIERLPHPGGRPVFGGGRGISNDGRYVTFYGFDREVVPNDELMSQDAFVYDRREGRVERVSVTSSGAPCREPPPSRFMAFYDPVISGNGRYVTMHGVGSCVPEYSSQTWNDAYIYDRATGTMEMVNRSSASERAASCAVETDTPGLVGLFSGLEDRGARSAVDHQGKTVSFVSCSANLGARTKSGIVDAYARDRGAPVGVGELVAAGKARQIALEEAPRFSRTGTVWIPAGPAGARVPGLDPASELLGARLTYRPLLGDIYVVLEVAELPHTPALATATAGAVYGMSFVLDDDAYEIRASSTGIGPRGETTATFGLFSCSTDDLLCTKLSELDGGFGTTGHRITFSVPLDALGIRDGSVISKVEAFAGLGRARTGATRILSAARLRR